MRILPPITQETVQQARFAHFSHQAVRNMYEAAIAKHRRLQFHRDRMETWLSMEYDLYELLRLAERTQRVDRNISRLEERIRELRGELAKREIRDLQAQMDLAST